MAKTPRLHRGNSSSILLRTILIKMDKFTKKIVKKGREEWKNSFIKKIKNSKTAEKAVAQIIAEYIYYSGRIREIKTRTKMIIKGIESQMEFMPLTREDIDPKHLKSIKKNLQNLRKKL